jgi:hypothetical protein
VARVLDEDELIQHWTLVGDELGLLAGRTGPVKLGLGLWLKFFLAEGPLPSGRSELPDEAVAWVARQVKVPASDIGLFDWEGRTAERLHSVIRKFTGFWTFYFFQLIVGYGLLIIAAPVGVIVALGLLIPKIAITARRLHETGHSGWWQLIQLIPILGWIILITMLAQRARISEP